MLSARCLRRFAGRPGHAGRAGRAIDLGPARPAQKANPDRRYQRLLGPAAGVDRSHASGEIGPPALRVDFLVAKRIEEILPMLQEAARNVAEADKAMAVPAERL